MEVLIAYASKHSGVSELSAALAEGLRAEGCEVDLSPVDQVPRLDGYDAVIVGSGIYFGKWLPGARDFVREHSKALRTVSVWLFSSGPVGRDEETGPEPFDASLLIAMTGARDHREFGGRLDRSGLGLMERMAVRMVGAEDGDDRDWQAVRDWSREIALALRGATQPVHASE